MFSTMNKHHFSSNASEAKSGSNPAKSSNGYLETNRLLESWFRSLQRRGFKTLSATAHIDENGIEFLTVRAEMRNPLSAREPIKAGVES